MAPAGKLSLEIHIIVTVGTVEPRWSGCRQLKGLDDVDTVKFQRWNAGLLHINESPLH